MGVQCYMQGAVQCYMQGEVFIGRLLKSKRLYNGLLIKPKQVAWKACVCVVLGFVFNLAIQ